MNLSRREFISNFAKGALLSPMVQTPLYAAEITPWHEKIAAQANSLSSEHVLQVMAPNGSGPNVSAVVSEFTRLSGINCIIEEVAVNNINIELILRSAAGENTVDVALPATFGIPELVQANAIHALDELAARYEPEGFSDGYLYRKGDYYRNYLYGYQTDGDVYLLFYNKRMLEDPAERKAYKRITGKALAPATSWEELDAMMAFFHRPEQNQYGGSLFRNPGYLVWEWWARFHAKGSRPFSNDMQVNVNNEAGVEALEELVAASDSLSPGSRSNGLFDNWADFAQGNVFCNIGWGGTQKYLMASDTMRDNLVHAALPGPMIDGQSSPMGYFNWGWDYTVSTGSTQPELAYLLALFCSTPVVSTLAIREDGFFDPFRVHHYQDQVIRDVYGDSFLAVHKYSMENSIPDLYIAGQSNYLDVLRQQILSTVDGRQTAREAMNLCAQKWTQITRRLGTASQTEQWRQLYATYPARIRDNLHD